MATKRKSAPSEAPKFIRVGVFGQTPEEVAVDAHWTVSEFKTSRQISHATRVIGVTKKGAQKILQDTDKINGYSTLFIVAEKVSGGC